MTSDLAQLDRDRVWHPFTQQQAWVEEEPLVIERGEGSYLVDVEGRRYLDGVSSLWCTVHGHRHPLIDKALRDQLGLKLEPVIAPVDILVVDSAEQPTAN